MHITKLRQIIREILIIEAKGPFYRNRTGTFHDADGGHVGGHKGRNQDAPQWDAVGDEYDIDYLEDTMQDKFSDAANSQYRVGARNPEDAFKYMDYGVDDMSDEDLELADRDVEEDMYMQERAHVRRRVRRRTR